MLNTPLTSYGRTQLRQRGLSPLPGILLALLTLLALTTAALLSTAPAASAEGGLDHFLVEAAPQGLAAGQAATITITAMDRANNPIFTYQNNAPITLAQQGGTAATMTWSGAGIINNPGEGMGMLGAGQFLNGTATLQLTDTTAEGPITVMVTEGDLGGKIGDTTVSSTDIMWTAGVLDHFRVEALSTILPAGGAASLIITAQDAGNNTITTYQNGAPLTLSQTGGTASSVSWNGSGVVAGEAGGAFLTTGQFLNGTTTVMVSDARAEGPVTVTVTEADLGGKSGSTSAIGSDITWMSGGLDHFQVETSPTTLMAGEPVAVTITAQDAQNNALVTYQNGAPVTISQMGGKAATMTWSGDGVTNNPGVGVGTLVTGKFVNGVAKATLSNTTAEGPVVVIVTEGDLGGRNGTSTPTGSDVTWNPAPLDHFRVAAASTDLAIDAAATITVTAQDRYDNTIHAYQNDAPLTAAQQGGTAETLTWGGGGVQADAHGGATLAAGSFADGAATITVTNAKAEGPVTVTVTAADGKTGSTAASATNVAWTAGQLDHFRVSASPAALTAGAAATITITAQDVHNNNITWYQNAQPLTLSLQGGAAAALAWSGGGVADHAGAGTGTLAPQSFTKGTVTVTLIDKRAEGPVAAVVTDDGGITGSTAGSDTNITWTVGTLDHFRVTAAPKSTAAGRAVIITIIAEDARNNPVIGYQNTGAIALRQSGGTAEAMTWSGGGVTTEGRDRQGKLASGQFIGGLATIALADGKVEGPVTITASEPGGKSGSTEATNSNVTWTAGTLDHFRVTAAKTKPAAGEAVSIVIRAEDAANNVITGWQNLQPMPLLSKGAIAAALTWGGDGVVNNAGTGSGLLSAKHFTGGVATVTLTNVGAEGMVVASVRDSSGKTGSTEETKSNITWTKSK